MNYSQIIGYKNEAYVRAKIESIEYYPFHLHNEDIEIICVNEQQAYAACRDIAAAEGMLVGISSGAAVHAAASLAKREENAGKTIVALLPDGGEKYMSMGLFDRQGE